MKRSESANNLAKHHRKCGSRRGYLLPAFISALATLIFCVGVTAQAATITVNSSAGTLTDSGKCTLRGAIGSINSGSNQNNCVAVVSPDAYGINDTITFDTTVFSAATTIMVSPEITITKSLTIDGALDGNGDPLITLDGNSANRILNVTGSGSVLTVSGLVFQNGNVVGYDNNGGAIRAENDVDISNSTFINNRTNWDGGAIYTVDNIANVSSSTFDRNRSRNRGGAIYAENVDVSDSIFIGNVAEDEPGGAIHATITASINNSTFDKNQAWSGGAIRAGDADVNDSTFTENKSHYGGAIFTVGDAKVNNSMFDRNQVSSHGGAIHAVTANINDSAFESNSAGFFGGAIYVVSIANVGNGTFTENHADRYGGAIFASDNTTANIHISGSVFESNTADQFGGAILSFKDANISNSTLIGNQANIAGGAILITSGTLEVRHLTLLDNSAGDADGGAAILVNSSGGNVRIHNSLILSSGDLVGATTLCSGNGTFTSSYNIEWVNGADTTSCNTMNPVIAGNSVTLAQIVSSSLADNGGPTPTLALPAGSPAIGAVDPSGATSQMLDIDFSPPVTATWVDATHDQRGIARAVTSAERSIGAFEYKAPSPPPVNGATSIPVLPAPLALLLALGLVGVGLRKLKVIGR